MKKLRQDLQNYIRTCSDKNVKIAGYGASVGVTTLLYYFSFGQYINCLYDDSAHKANLFSPGLELPVKISEQLYVDKPNVIVLFCWRYADVIIKKHRRFIEQGGVFLIPLPDMKIIDMDYITNHNIQEALS